MLFDEVAHQRGASRILSICVGAWTAQMHIGQLKDDKFAILGMKRARIGKKLNKRIVHVNNT